MCHQRLQERQFVDSWFIQRKRRAVQQASHTLVLVARNAGAMAGAPAAVLNHTVTLKVEAIAEVGGGEQGESLGALSCRTSPPSHCTAFA